MRRAWQVIELGKDPEACVHTRLKVIVGERFLVTYTNAVPAVALESELIPAEERMSTLMEVRRVRKSKDKAHNRLEASQCLSITRTLTSSTRCASRR